MNSSCCASTFTWASTSDSEAQDARDKHNCRYCGSLVCDACSTNRVPLPDMGINIPSRVCDRCYYDMGSALSDENALTRSFIEESHNCTVCSDLEITSKDSKNVENEKVKFVPKRSEVIDQLVLQMPSSTPGNVVVK